MSDKKTVQDLSNTVKAFNDFGEAIRNAQEAMYHGLLPMFNRISQGLTVLHERMTPIILETFEYLQPIIIQRREDESLVEWANRLEDMGLWDDPDVRWVYQKECLQVVFLAPYRWIKYLINKL